MSEPKKHRNYDVKNCDGVDVEDVLRREQMRKKRVDIDMKKAEILDNVEKFINTFRKQLRSEMERNSTFLSTAGKQWLPGIDDLDKQSARVASDLRARKDKIIFDINNASEPVVDLVCAEKKKK